MAVVSDGKPFNGMDDEAVAATLLSEATRYAGTVLVHRMQCIQLCTSLQTLLEHGLNQSSPQMDMLFDIHQHMQAWSQLDHIQSYLASEQIIRDIDRLYEDLRSCGLKTKDIAVKLLEVRRQDFVSLKTALPSIIKNPDDLKRISTLSSDDIQIFMRSLQRAIREEPNTNNLYPELQEALMILFKEANGKIPTPDLTSQITNVSIEPVNPNGNTPVYRGNWLDKEEIALKSLQRFLADVRIRKIFQQNVRSWHSLHHPNVLQFYGLCLDVERGCCLVAPWMTHNSILPYLENHHDADVLRLIHDVACGLRYLHSCNPPIIHGDVRSANVLIKVDGRACLSDFGLAEIAYTYEMSRHSRTFGPVRWQAPELVVYRTDERPSFPQYSKASDIYALGVTMFEVRPFIYEPIVLNVWSDLILPPSLRQIFTSRPPFDHIKDDTCDLLRETILNGCGPELPDEVEFIALQRGLSKDVWFLMECCWHHDVSVRPESQHITRRLHAIIGKRHSDVRSKRENPNIVDKANVTIREGYLQRFEHSDLSSSSAFAQRNESFSSVSTGDSQAPSFTGSRLVLGNANLSADSASTQSAARRLRGLRNSERNVGVELDKLHPLRSPLAFTVRRRSMMTSSPLVPVTPDTGPTSRFSFDTSPSEDSYERSVISKLSSSTSNSPKMGRNKDRFHVLVSKMTQASELRPDWVGVANMEELRAYAPFQLRQQSLIEALVKKETVFLSSSLDTIFAQGLHSVPAILGDDVESFVDDIFEGIRGIRLVHRDFLHGLQARPSLAAGGIQHVALLCTEAAVEFRSVYTTYSRSLPRVIHRLIGLTYESPSFDALMQEVTGDRPTMRTRLLTYLKEPLFHLEEYATILKAIMKQGPAQHSDSPAIRLAYEEMALTVRQVRLASWQYGHMEASLDELLDAEVLQSLLEHEVIYQQANFQLISLERTFVKVLHLIDETLLQPLDRPSFDVDLPESISCMLIEVYGDLLRLHGQIAENMYGVQQEQHPKLQDLISQSGIMEMPWSSLYEQRYIQCVREAMKSLDSDPTLIFRINQKIQSIPCEDIGLDRTFTAFLRAPALHLRSFVKTLSHIADLNPQANEERTTIVGLLSTLGRITQICDDTIAESKDRAVFDRIATTLAFTQFPGVEIDLNLFSSSRRLILTGSFYVQDISGISEFHEAFVVLLDNYLLLTTLSDRQGLARYELQSKPIPLELLELVNDESVVTATRGGPLLPAVIVRHKIQNRRTISLCCESSSMRQLLAKSLRQAVIQRMQQAKGDRILQFNLIHRFSCPPVCSMAMMLNHEGLRIFACDGSQPGIWIQRRDQSPYLALQLRGINGLAALPSWDWMLVLVDQNVFAYRLEDLVIPNRPASSQKIEDSKTVKFMRFGKLNDRIVLVMYLIRKGRNILKLLEPLWKTNTGGSRRPFKSKTDIFRLRGELVFPHRVQDIAFLKSRLVVISDLSFHLVDAAQPHDAGSQTLPLPGDPMVALAERCKSSHPVAMHRTGDDFLLCYSDFGAYVNSGGRLTNKILEWESNRVSCVIFRPPRMFVIGSELIEIRDLASGRREQLLSMLDNIQTLWDGRDIGLGCDKLDCCFHISARSRHASNSEESDDGSVCSFEVIMNNVS